MSDWYYLKHRKPIPYGCDILTNPVQYVKTYHKHSRSSRRVRRKFIGGYHISTIFLGLDHSYHDGEPILFETMIFKGGSMVDINCNRCYTHRQALGMHRDAIKWVKKQ